MLRAIAILLAALAISSLCAASDSTYDSSTAADDLQIFTQAVPKRSAAFLASLGITQPTAAVTQQTCCKVCTTGKACGDTCISRDEICHVKPGCACDG